MSLNRNEAYKFFRNLIKYQEPEEQVAFLLDILVNEFCFGFPTEAMEADLRKYVLGEIDKGNFPAKRIFCIKEVKERCGCSLQEAKDFVVGIESNPTHELKIQSETQGIVSKRIEAKLREIAVVYGIG